MENNGQKRFSMKCWPEEYINDNEWWTDQPDDMTPLQLVSSKMKSPSLDN